MDRADAQPLSKASRARKGPIDAPQSCRGARGALGRRSNSCLGPQHTGATSANTLARSGPLLWPPRLPVALGGWLHAGLQVPGLGMLAGPGSPRDRAWLTGDLRPALALHSTEWTEELAQKAQGRTGTEAQGARNIQSAAEDKTSRAAGAPPSPALLLSPSSGDVGHGAREDSGRWQMGNSGPQGGGGGGKEGRKHCCRWSSLSGQVQEVGRRRRGTAELHRTFPPTLRLPYRTALHQGSPRHKSSLRLEGGEASGRGSGALCSQEASKGKGRPSGRGGQWALEA